MTIKEWAGLLAGLSYPVAHYEFARPTSAPCLVYTDQYNSLHADSINVLEDYVPTLELYCKPGDHAPRRELEETLISNAISYTIDSAWVSDRREVEYIFTLD